MIQKKNSLERKMQAVFCGFLVVLLGLGTLVPSVPAERQLWIIETVDSTWSVGTYTSLALDNNGYPHISYLDATNTALKYAYWDGTSWHNVTVDNIFGDVGYYTSLALDTSGYPHISHCNVLSGDLRYSYKDSGGWHTLDLDIWGNTGRFTSLALDGSGYPHISYYDGSNYDLKYAYEDSGGWHIVTVDSLGNVGASTSLALDTSGYPHISYRDSTNYDLKYTYQDSTGWHTSTVDSLGNVGWYSSLALDTSEYPHISYLDETNDDYDLKYAYMDAGGWHTSTVDSLGNVGEYTSLALDTSSYPHISYYDYDNGDLKYAYKDSGGWHTSTVDNTGDVGEYTSLALDTTGYPHISYRDYTNGDLKYAYSEDTTPPAITNVHATPTIQLPGGNVTVFCTITDNEDVGDARVNITYPDSSTVNVSMPSRNDYTYSAMYTLPGTYTYFIWANDTNGNSASSASYQFTIATTDYLKITYHSQNEIPDTTISTHFSLDCYAGAFNDTHGFVAFVDANWNVQNSGGSNASINTTSGESVSFFSGWYDGTATVTTDDGSGHSDSVVFTVDLSALSYMMYQGWNLIGWHHDYTTTAASLGQNISGCTVVCRFNGDSQSYTTHVVGIPYNNFTVRYDRGLFIYTTMCSIWNGDG